MRRRGPQPHTLLGAAVVVLLALALLPTSITGWVSAFQGPLRTVVGPVSGTMLSAAAAVRPSTAAPRERLEEDELVRQRNEAIRSLQQANREIEQLRERLAVVERFRAAALAPVEPRVVRVIGRELGAGTISIRIGARDGAREGLPVVDDSATQLIGRVVRVGPTTSVVRLITSGRASPGSRAAGSRWLRGVVIDPDAEIMDADRQAELPRVDLSPTGDGAFVSAEVRAAAAIAPGGIVKLDDPAWPPEAQLFEIGAVEAILPIDQPLMTKARVRPRIDELELVARVVVLMPLDESNAPRRSDGADATTGDRQ